MDRAKIIKITVIVVGFATAGAFSAYFFLSDGPPPVKPDDAKMVDLVCVDSGEHVQATFEFIASHGISNDGRGRRPSAEPEPVTVDVYPVPDCGESGAVLANYCNSCDRYFAKLSPDGSKGVCPKCGQ